MAYNEDQARDDHGRWGEGGSSGGGKSLADHSAERASDASQNARNASDYVASREQTNKAPGEILSGHKNAAVAHMAAAAAHRDAMNKMNMEGRHQEAQGHQAAIAQHEKAASDHRDAYASAKAAFERGDGPKSPQESLRGNAEAASQKASFASKHASQDPSAKTHEDAGRAHMMASTAHHQAWSEAVKNGDGSAALYHQGKADSHRESMNNHNTLINAFKR